MKCYCISLRTRPRIIVGLLFAAFQSISLRLVLLVVACSRNCPAGSRETRPCDEIADRVCSGECIVLHCIVLYFIAFHFIALYCSVLYSIALHCIVFYFILFYCIVLYCILLYCIVYRYPYSASHGVNQTETISMHFSSM